MIKVGIIGTGIGRLHAASYQKCPDVEIKAICDIDLDSGNRAAQEFGASDVYADYREMLKDVCPGEQDTDSDRRARAAHPADPRCDLRIDRYG